jgi:hypothetical protein
MSFGGGGNDSAKKSYKLQKKQIAAQNAYNAQQHKYNWGIDGNGNQLKNADGTNQGSNWSQHYYNVETLEKQKQIDQAAKDYQEDTAQQNWEMGKSQQTYEWEQQDKIYDKSEDQYVDTILFNQIEYNDAKERENKVLEEQFIQFGFENQNMIADLYEGIGGKGFDQAAQKLGLLKTEDAIESQKVSMLTKLQHQTKSAKYSDASVKIGMLDKKGKAEHTEASLVQDLATSEANNRFKKAALLMDVDQQGRGVEFQNEMIRRQTSATYADAAHKSQERAIEALKRQGQAQLSQAGRSQGKAVQMVLAELGRQSAYLSETLIRGTASAESKAKFNSQTQASSKAKSQLQLQQLQEDSKNNINKTLLNLEESQRDLKISDTKSVLNLDQIKNQIFNNVENTAIDVKTLENNLLHAQSATGLNLKKIDWDIDNLGSQFKNNQDILKASIDSAVEVSALNQKGLLRDLEAANLQAEAKRLLDPSMGREALNLDYYKPLDLPEAVYQDPLEPKVPPAPIPGAMPDSSIGTAGVLNAAAGGAIAGMSTAGMLSSGGLLAGLKLSQYSNPIGWAVGAMSFLSQL